MADLPIPIDTPVDSAGAADFARFAAKDAAAGVRPQPTEPGPQGVNRPSLPPGGTEATADPGGPAKVPEWTKLTIPLKEYTDMQQPILDALERVVNDEIHALLKPLISPSAAAEVPEPGNPTKLTRLDWAFQYAAALIQRLRFPGT